MSARPSISLKELIKLKKECAEMEEQVNLLKMENFEAALRVNRKENLLSNISALIGNDHKKVSESVQNLYVQYDICNSHKSKDLQQNITEAKRLSQSLGANATPAANKAHVVKPHMVNGTILYIPTINLTRVTDVQPQNASANASEDDPANASVVSSTTSADNSVSEIADGENPEAESSSNSRSHSTVLSGTFKEVKIYLNQVSPTEAVANRRSANINKNRGKKSKE